MKKAISVLAASAALLVPAMNSSASSFSTDEPTLYFKAQEQDNTVLLPSGRVYVNIKAQPDGAKINTGVYCYDSEKATNLIFVKWQSGSENVTLSDIVDPITAVGNAPYAKWTKPETINVVSRESDNFMAVSYSRIVDGALELTGENSDDYPLACFTANVKPETPAGVYNVDFITEGDNKCTLSYSDPIKDFRPSGDYARSLEIAVSDRELGDVNNSGKIEAADASKVLVAYASMNAGSESGLTAAEEISADLNGDGKLSATDASLILVKYADLSGS